MQPCAAWTTFVSPWPSISHRMASGLYSSCMRLISPATICAASSQLMRS